MSPRKQPAVAFVLSGGASLGAIQVGMLRALYERGIRPDLIVGTSAGALNGAYIATRPQTAATADGLARIWRELRRSQVFPVNPLTGLLGFLGARDHLVPQSGLRRLIEDHVECAQLEEVPIPLHVVAVDVVTGEELRLSHGPTLDAILASAAIPGVLGRSRWRTAPSWTAAWPTTPRSPTPSKTHRRLIDDIERHRHDVQLIVLPPPCPLDVQPIDFAHARELIDVATDAREFLESGGEMRSPLRMRMHRHANVEDGKRTTGLEPRPTTRRSIAR
jgi:NTE family protein